MLQRLLIMIWPKYWWQTSLIIILLLINGVLASLSVLSIIPFLDGINVSSNNNGQILSLFNAFFMFFDIKITTIVILTFVTIILIIKAMLSILCAYLSEWVRLEIETSHKKLLYKSLLNVKVDFLHKNNYGNLTNIIVLETRYLGMLINYLSRFSASFVELLVFGILVFFLSYQLTIGAVLLICLFYIFLKKLYVTANKLGTEVTKLNSEFQEHVNYTLTGYRVLKSLSGEKRFFVFLRDLLSNYKFKNLKMSLAEHTLNAVFEPLVLVVVVFALIFLSPSVPTLIIFIVALSKMYMALKVTQNSYYKISKHSPSLDFFEKSLKDLNNYQYDNNIKKIGFTEFKDKIIFNEVEYYYSNYIKKDFKLGPINNFSIHRGETIALVGPSGSGKSTFVDLLEGFIFPKVGSIKVDGIDIKKLNPEQYRNKFGYVSQDMFFLNDTIKNNIIFGNEKIKDVEIYNALKKSQALDFVNQLPEGINTLIGEQGSRLSGGQKQRISLARALVKVPEVLILDEATSALDNETERRVWNTIEKLKGQITVIIIAHKLSFISKVDKIYVIESGNIVENGTFKELMNKKGRFFKFYRNE